MNKRKIETGPHLIKPSIETMKVGSHVVIDMSKPISPEKLHNALKWYYEKKINVALNLLNVSRISSETSLAILACSHAFPLGVHVICDYDLFIHTLSKRAVLPPEKGPLPELKIYWYKDEGEFLATNIWS